MKETKMRHTQGKVVVEDSYDGRGVSISILGLDDEYSNYVDVADEYLTAQDAIVLGNVLIAIGMDKLG